MFKANAPSMGTSPMETLQINTSGVAMPFALVLSSLDVNNGPSDHVVVDKISAEGSTGNGVCEIGELSGFPPNLPG